MSQEQNMELLALREWLNRQEYVSDAIKVKDVKDKVDDLIHGKYVVVPSIKDDNRPFSITCNKLEALYKMFGWNLYGGDIVLTDGCDGRFVSTRTGIKSTYKNVK